MDPLGLLFNKINSAEKIVEKTYCDAWMRYGSAGCDKVAFYAYNNCLVAGASIRTCQILYRKYFVDCTQKRLDCQKKEENNNESCEINTTK